MVGWTTNTTFTASSLITYDTYYNTFAGWSGSARLHGGPKHGKTVHWCYGDRMEVTRPSKKQPVTMKKDLFDASFSVPLNVDRGHYYLTQEQDSKGRRIAAWTGWVK